MASVLHSEASPSSKQSELSCLRKPSDQGCVRVQSPDSCLHELKFVQPCALPCVLFRSPYRVSFFHVDTKVSYIKYFPYVPSFASPYEYVVWTRTTTMIGGFPSQSTLFFKTCSARTTYLYIQTSFRVPEALQIRDS